MNNHWQPVKTTHTPLYKQIYLYIRSKIISGEWPVNTRLPAQRLLAEQLSVNRSTLRIAIDELIANGFLASRMGSGIWVSSNSWAAFSSNPVNWKSYVDSTELHSNLPLIQQINKLEFDNTLTRLGTGELSPQLIPENIIRTLTHEAARCIDSFGYEQPKGLLYLRQQISNHLKERGITASPESIMIVSGSLQALQLIFFGLLPADASIFLERPSYLLSLRLFQSLHHNFTELPLDDNGLLVSALYKQQSHHAAHAMLYTIPTFHNPTGIIMSEARRHELIKACQELRLPILEDDVYRDLWFTNSAPPPLKSLDTQGSVLYIDSLSKSVSPGLRIGWIVGPEPVIERLADLKMQHDYGSSCLSEWVAALWLRDGLYNNHLRKLRTELFKRQSLVNSVLQAHFTDIAEWTLPHGGFYIWLKLKTPISMHRLFQLALKEKILLNPGTLYDSLANSQLRLSFAYAEPAALKNALIKLSSIIHKESGN